MNYTSRAREWLEKNDPYDSSFVVPKAGVMSFARYLDEQESVELGTMRGEPVYSKPQQEKPVECEHKSITKLPTCNDCGAIVYKPEEKPVEIEELEVVRSTNPVEWHDPELWLTQRKLNEVIRYLKNL